jgi:hypothetical protein
MGASPKPDLLFVDDFGSGTRNEQLTPGNIARIRGSRLKFDASDPLQGVFLVAANNSATKVATVSRNKPGQVDFLVPSLPPGDLLIGICRKLAAAGLSGSCRMQSAPC